MRIEERAVSSAAVSPSAISDRINRHRLGSFTFAARDKAGAPAAFSDLKISLSQHAFAFGTAIEPEVVAAAHGREFLGRYLKVVTENFWR